MGREPSAQRYAAWVDAHRHAIVLGSLVVAAIGVLLAMRLTLRSDLSSLLPESRASVHDLMQLQKRARAFGKVFVMLEAPEPAVRAVAAEQVVAGFARIDKQLVGHVSIDDGPRYQHVWAHRFLYAELGDLEAARDALTARLARARRDANPLFVDLDDAAPKDPKGDRFDELRAKLADAEAKASRPSTMVSQDGRLQLITIDAQFASSDQPKATALLAAVQRVLDDVHRDHPTVTSGITGTVTMSLAEHASVVDGMVMAGLITLGLCAIALLLYFRARRVVAALLCSLVVGVLATLGVTYLVIGYLNVMSAFLTAIVIGNGVNAGLVLVSRYFEELGDGVDPRAAIGPAIAGALPGTLAAVATAAVAYVSLVVSDFRGFRHFGVIAAVGMVLTWITTFTTLPALLAMLARAGAVRPRPTPRLVRALRKTMPQRVGPVLAFAALITTTGIVLTVRFLAGDPFTRDWREMASTNREIRALRALDQKLGDNIPGSARFSGLSYQLVLGVDSRDQVAPLVATLRALDATRPADQKLFLDVLSIDDLLPKDQVKKLAVLAEIRTLLDGEVAKVLTDDELATVAKLRPPDDLRVLGDADLPHELGWQFVEQDGSIGKLISVRGATRFKTWNVADREAFAREIRKVALPAGAVMGGEPLVIADIVETMEHDAPIMIAIALIGSILAIVVVLGLRRHAAITIVCGFSGVAVMIAGCALAGLHINFLDLIALPITIGIGVDYAVNIAARDRDPTSTRDHLAATAAAVVLCSYTTTVGYGSLLLSANGGIRAFALAAIIGEVACIFTAIILAPALLMRLRARAAARAAR
ncbi:MAG: MMPL family transporter [Proteobacteria bacterium]|nr:MMPL family transporter [Pseudomonadota bacterium]